MTHSTSLLEGPSQAMDSIRSRTLAPVLIQVPKLSPAPGSAGRTTQPARGGRRRLRREVRVAFSAMAFALPMSWAMLTFGKVGPEPERPAPMTATLSTSSVEGSPLATLSVDSGVDPATPEPEAPAVLPAGYLVPDDRAEGSNDAGN